MTLWKWLTLAVQEGLVERAGLGTRKEPHRYQLPGMAMMPAWRWSAVFIRRWKRTA